MTADVEYTQEDLDLAYLQAAQAGNAQELRNALAWGANIYVSNFRNGWDAMNYAIASGSLETLAALKDAGYEFNGRLKHRYSTPLNFAMRTTPMQPAVIKELIKLGADINGVDDNGYDPLCTCLKERNREGITLLMELGANPALAQKGLAEYRFGGGVRDHFEMEELLQKKRTGEACSAAAINGTAAAVAPLRPFRLKAAAP